MGFYGWEVTRLSIRILEVTPASPADLAGIRPGDFLLRINDEPVIDEIDYQALTSSAHLSVTFERIGGEIHTSDIRKPKWEPLGLCLDETVAMKPRHCRNHCLFCFIDQLPSGMRETLYVKDDDWRLSLMMGNYVTLTNVDDAEFNRILRRRASPVYISVHATDPETRIRLLRNPNAGNIMERLTRLKENGIRFHGQIVLCPGINDGSILEKTIEDCASLFPSARSLAIVPIGMTCHRDKLVRMQPVTPEKAEEVIRTAEAFQDRFLKNCGTRFVYPSDEFYCICGHSLPSGPEYEDYPQIENGVGMLRQLEEECAAADAEMPKAPSFSGKTVRILIPTGVSARPFIEKLAVKYAPPGVHTEVIAVKNRFFGESITVTGLIVGRDLIDAVRGYSFDRVLISETMLRENTDRFLDDVTLEEVRCKIGKPVIVVGNTGEAFVRALRMMEVDHE